MDQGIAIQAEHLSKTFILPHESINTIRERVFRFGKKRSYETFHALNDISFTVNKGEFFGILGRNGSGKSTLLKILAGIYTPDSGGVTVNGEVSPFLELGVGFNPELSGRDNIFLNATILGLQHAEILSKFDEIVAFSELERFLDQKLKNYSSGMQVRLAFSVAIHANKGILLMDEVLAVGDTNFQSKCISEFIRFKQEGNTVILVTHDTGVVQKYCDRAMLLKNGELQKIGDPEQVTSAYIYQNMYDEEKRRLDELNREKDKQEIKVKSNIEVSPANAGITKKIAEIGGIDFFNGVKENKNTFEQGEDLVVRIYLKKNMEPSPLHLDVTIFNREANVIFGASTKNDGITAKSFIEQGFADMEFRHLPLGKNTYYLSVKLMDETGLAPVDMIARSKDFVVISKNHNTGIVNLDYSWK